MKKIILIGSSGYIGKKIHEEILRRKIGCLPLRGIDVLDASGAVLEKAVCDYTPDFVFCAAGYTGKPNVDACEYHKAECMAGNAVLPGIVKQVCDRNSLKWGHISSGCIFTGNTDEGSGFTETDPPNFSFRQDNCSFYSGCKALGEEALGYGCKIQNGKSAWVSDGLETGYVWRIRIPFEAGNNPRNYISKVMAYKKLLDAENSITDLGEAVPVMVDMAVSDAATGIYNVTQPGSVTTRQLVGWIQESPLGATLTKQGKEFMFFSSDEDFYRTAAQAPRSNCVLDTSKIQKAGFGLRPVEIAVRECLEKWTN
ncbi:MAG: hypothetical protein BWK80_41170 [Desulfobacteraceae bacterium IS3]|nr:MAG: hypothetical protein BWK80_41170 [Desulfobacteraceae bacterium IS3]